VLRKEVQPKERRKELKTAKHCCKKQKTQINGKICHVHGLENLILERQPYYSK
jgi:hypothetical protein